MKKYSNKTVIESLELPILTCFDDLVKELSLSGKLVYWLTKQDAEGRYKTFFIPKVQIALQINTMQMVQR